MSKFAQTISWGLRGLFDGVGATPSPKGSEAREILRFVEDDADAPEAVVIADALKMADRTRFHEEIADRFPVERVLRPSYGLCSFVGMSAQAQEALLGEGLPRA